MKDYFGENPVYYVSASHFPALLSNATVLIFEDHA
jgi:hypothetical protein